MSDDNFARPNGPLSDILNKVSADILSDIPLEKARLSLRERMNARIQEMPSAEAPTIEQIIGEQVELLVNKATAQTVTLVNECRAALDAIEGRLIASASLATRTLKSHILFGRELEVETRRIKETISQLETDHGI